MTYAEECKQVRRAHAWIDEAFGCLFILKDATESDRSFKANGIRFTRGIIDEAHRFRQLAERIHDNRFHPLLRRYDDLNAAARDLLGYFSSCE